tara:strand:+ start:82762 stop:83790 length:1029 start_codon:yes stop_codon:yes gene_type:complete
MRIQTTRLLPLIPLAICATAAHAQLIETQYDSPSLDRWMYPFNGSPGTRFEMSVFGAPLLEGFDDHDAQVLVGFDTSTEFAPSLGSDQYRVHDITVTMTIANDNGFVYDDSYDDYTTYGVDGEPNDLDPGHPINLFLPGYKPGISQSTFFENSSFGSVPEVAPAQGMRNVFAAIFDNEGFAQNISNHVKEQFNAVPLAIGTSDLLTTGDLVPADTTISFTFTPCDAGARDELARMLDRGELRFIVSAMSPASGGPGGGEGDYPIFYTKENPLAQIFGYAATLDIRARVGSFGDYNGDGSKNFLDVSAFLSDFGNGDVAADINGDCGFNFLDVSAFLSEFSSN